MQRFLFGGAGGAIPAMYGASRDNDSDDVQPYCNIVCQSYYEHQNAILLKGFGIIILITILMILTWLLFKRYRNV